MCCPLVFEFSVGIGGFVIGLGQISYFFSHVILVLLYFQPNFNYWTLVVSGTELQTDKQTDGRTNDPITRCPQWTFQGHKTVLSKYSRVLSDIGLTEFEILSDRTKFCQTELFLYLAYNFGHMMILGLNTCMYCSKTNEQSDSSKIQCYYCSSVTCHVVVPGKAKHDGGMDGRTDDGRKDPYFSDTR